MQKDLNVGLYGYLAERARFELAGPVKVLRFSRPVHSTALPPLPVNDNGQLRGIT